MMSKKVWNQIKICTLTSLNIRGKREQIIFLHWYLYFLLLMLVLLQVCFSSIKTTTLFISRHINIILHWGVFGWSELNFGHIQKCSVFIIGTNHSNFLNRLHLDTWRVVCQKAFHTWNNVNIWLETIYRLEICLFMDIRQIIDLGCKAIWSKWTEAITATSLFWSIFVPWVVYVHAFFKDQA